MDKCIDSITIENVSADSLEKYSESGDHVIGKDNKSSSISLSAKIIILN